MDDAPRYIPIYSGYGMVSGHARLVGLFAGAPAPTGFSTYRQAEKALSLAGRDPTLPIWLDNQLKWMERGSH